MNLSIVDGTTKGVLIFSMPETTRHAEVELPLTATAVNLITLTLKTAVCG